jgi:hypothetical protein
MVLAQRATDTVGIGKLRTAYIIPHTHDHYQSLPAATTKPNTPKNLDSIGVDNYTHMKPIDYIGLYIIVTVLCTVATNWLYRIYF